MTAPSAAQSMCCRCGTCQRSTHAVRKRVAQRIVSVFRKRAADEHSTFHWILHDGDRGKHFHAERPSPILGASRYVEYLERDERHNLAIQPQG